MSSIALDQRSEHLLHTLEVISQQSLRINQRTNGPVKAHMRYAVYINKYVSNIMENSPSKGADEDVVPSFLRIINILSICQYPASFSLQMAFYVLLI